MPLKPAVLDSQTDRRTDRQTDMGVYAVPSSLAVTPSVMREDRVVASGWLGDGVVQKVQLPFGSHEASVPPLGCLAL